MEIIPMRPRYLKSVFLAMSFLGLAQWNEVTFAQSAEQLYERALAGTCTNCHGTDGKGVVDGGIPLINQLSSAEILTQLKAYKSGTLDGTIMPQLAKGYSDQQLTTIANQFGKKP
jgi:cytochrome c553